MPAEEKIANFWILGIGLGLVAIGMVLGIWIAPTKYKASEYTFSYFGDSLCDKSEGNITQELTVVAEIPNTTQDSFCLSMSGKYRMYSTKEGLYFDTFRTFLAGDKIRVTGHYYMADPDFIVISGNLIEDIDVKKLPLIISSPTATPINVKIQD